MENKKDVPPQEREKHIDIELLPQKLEPILQNIPKPQKQKILQEVKKIVAVHSFIGPIPPPEILKGYDEIIKGGAERILIMAEKQSGHRMALEDHSVKEGIRLSSRGQIFGFVLGIIIILVAAYLGLRGHDWLAGILGTTTIGSFLTAFVIGKKR